MCICLSKSQLRSLEDPTSHSLSLTLSRFRQGHVPGSLNLPHHHTFQPDGSLSPSSSASLLTSLRGKSVLVVVANKGETGPVVC